MVVRPNTPPAILPETISQSLFSKSNFLAATLSALAEIEGGKLCHYDLYLCPFDESTLIGMVVDVNLEKEKLNMENRLDLLTSVDVLNTLHGGVSEPQVSVSQLDNSREVRIKVPSIDPESIQVEINNNSLFVYYVMTINSAGKNIRLPYTIYNRQLPYFIDIGKINSTVEGNQLVINLPFNALADGYHKKIRTRED